MEYAEEFQADFIRRTLRIISTYEGEYEVTLLVNCLLGLLIIPKEAFINAIPDDGPGDWGRWGLIPSSIIRMDRNGLGEKKLRAVLRRMRNAFAHQRFAPIHIDGEVLGFDLHDENGFAARISERELRLLATNLARHILDD